MLNRAGELVGINFDRNRHGLVRNFVYTDIRPGTSPSIRGPCWRRCESCTARRGWSRNWQASKSNPHARSRQAAGVGLPTEGLMVIWTLAKKDMRLLVRDARALIILLAMPLIFILVLGVSLGENFGKKPSEGLHVTVLNLDEGIHGLGDRAGMLREGLAGWRSRQPGRRPLASRCRRSLARANYPTWFPREKWSKLLLRDLNETGDIRVEFVKDRAEAEALVRNSQRAAVLVLGKEFSQRVERCSFLVEGLNPFHRTGSSSPRSMSRCYEGSDAADRRRHHRSGRAGEPVARHHAVDDRPGLRKDRRSGISGNARQAAADALP